ncbi:MAG: transketolase [Firmicutes bacterium]|nr:transketolase [Bacillota bacterium]
MTTTHPAVDLDRLRDRARELRRAVLEMIAAAGSGHPGGSLSAADIVAALFFHELRHDPHRPDWPDRDRFILSKGHAAPVLYAALAACGYFDAGLLRTLRRLGSPLQGHPSVRDLPPVEASTGSLGQGLSVGVGEALAGRLDGRDYRVFVMLGDGECDEGQVWEAAMSAAHYGLINLVAIVDANGFQLDGPTDEIMDLGRLEEKWTAFGWDAVTIDGHDMAQVVRALAVPRPDWGASRAAGGAARGAVAGGAMSGAAAEAAGGAARPRAIIARTVKGKGVSFMEGNNEFHGRAPTAEELQRALAELAAGGAAR